MQAKYNHYDVIIIGGGIGGLMAAYTLQKKGKILLIEKGNPLVKRSCPIINGKSQVCVGCSPCAIMQGLGGAGAFSDGKYVISTEYGGWLTSFLDSEVVMNYINKADNILVKHGASEERFMPDDELKLTCLKHDLHMQQAELKHLGTDENFNTMAKLVESIKENVELLTLTDAYDIDKKTNTVYYKNATTASKVTGENIIIAVGRAGSGFLVNWCKKNQIKLSNNQVDIGVRIELSHLIWKEFSQKIYEPKIWYRSKGYGDITRMFCFNEKGSVVVENTHGVLTVNGHAYKREGKKTLNSNFALLTTTKFTQPFNEPIEYAKYVASLANKISGGSVLVQRFGDLVQGRRSNEHRLASSTVRPTLKAVPGDLSLCMPKRQLDNIVETLYALDKVAPGTANHDTLLYGVECKYYSARPETENNFKLKNTNNIYAIGDGAGFTRSLSHAAAHGLFVADNLNL
ncbi:MAG: NAD(P)/FAD-dependent oxidoreductase [Bacillota bacterium]